VIARSVLAGEGFLADDRTQSISRPCRYSCVLLFIDRFIMRVSSEVHPDYMYFHVRSFYCFIRSFPAGVYGREKLFLIALLLEINSFSI
jgi:hypothetical protein